ncbi:MAG TPA: phosphate-starvation-inducible PsiE family protein [Nitrospiria bacterium]|nr:phosphate-starvation-inducible PsiE family protein [Nitrospiria bacterium]
MNNPSDQSSRFSIRWMESLERWGYITAGLSFLFLGMVIFAYGWYAFYETLGAGVLNASLMLMNDLLLVIILLELFRTVLNYLKTHTITLEPFLYVGIVAAIRRILTTGAQEQVLQMSSDQQFNRYLWDVGLNGLLIIVLVLALVFYKKEMSPKS